MIKALQNALGVSVDDPVELKAMLHDFYSTLYTSEGVTNMEAVLNTIPSKVTTDMNHLLCAPYTSDEVKITLFSDVPDQITKLGWFSNTFLSVALECMRQRGNRSSFENC